jgi:phage shock protein A
VSNHDDEVTRLGGEIEDKDTAIADMEEKLDAADRTIAELRAKVEAKPPRKRTKKESVADLV